MKNRIMQCMLIAAVCLLTGCSGKKADSGRAAVYDYSYADIVARLYDLSALAEYPQNGEKSAEFTSYDRKSYYDESTDSYVEWDANFDVFGSLSPNKDGTGVIAAEMHGAGYINRIWTTSDCVKESSTGHIRIYIDDNSEPVIDVVFRDLFLQTGIFGEYGNLAYGEGTTFVSYVPITYSSYCRVELVDDWGAFYHVGYTSLPEGSTVEPFSYPIADENVYALKTANEKLGNNQRIITNTEYTIAAGERVSIWHDVSSGAVTKLQLKIDQQRLNGSLIEAVRNLSISACWDNAPYCAIDVSVGDFFNAPTGIKENVCYPVGVLADGTMYANWYMPYSDGAEIVIKNNGEYPITFLIGIEKEELKKEAADSLMRFCAAWRIGGAPRTNHNQYPDSEFLTIKGTGRMVGVGMHNYMYADNVWWGEGDEKFYIDGEKFPSWFGTGTEDYFGYSYGNIRLFAKPFHSQSVVGEKDTAIMEKSKDIDTQWALMRGNKVLSRFHITDNVSFFNELRVVFEDYQGKAVIVKSACVFFYTGANDVENNIQDAYDVSMRNKYFPLLEK